MNKVTKKELVERVNEHEEAIFQIKKALEQHGIKWTEAPKLKQLDQSVFDGQDEQWQWAAFGNDGCRHVYLEKPRCGSYWEHSLIKRESKELTGSDLALELLKNQRYIIASVSDKSDADAIECGNNKLIHKSSEDIFTDDMGGIYCWAVALNNQGEPLTAADVGL